MIANNFGYFIIPLHSGVNTLRTNNSEVKLSASTTSLQSKILVSDLKLFPLYKH